MADTDDPLDSDRHHPEHRSRTDKALYYLKKIDWLLKPLLVLIALAFLAGQIPVPAALGTATRTIVASAIVTMLVGYVPAKNLLNTLYQPRLDTVVALDPVDPERPVDAYRIHPETWKQDVEIDGHSLDWAGATGQVHLVRAFDRTDLEAEGPWMGSRTDLELMNDREQIEAQRLRNNKAAQAGILALARLDSIEDEVKAAYFQNLVKDGMAFTAYDEDALLDPIRDQVPGLESDDHSDLEKIIAEQLGEDLPDDDRLDQLQRGVDGGEQ